MQIEYSDYATVVKLGDQEVPHSVTVCSLCMVEINLHRWSYISTAKPTHFITKHEH